MSDSKTTIRSFFDHNLKSLDYRAMAGLENKHTTQPQLPAEPVDILAVAARGYADAKARVLKLEYQNNPAESLDNKVALLCLQAASEDVEAALAFSSFMERQTHENH